MRAILLPFALLLPCSCAAPPAGAAAPEGAPDATPAAAARVVDTLALGSCARTGQPQPIWSTLAAHEPDLFVFLGDNVYADRDAVPQSAADIARAYEELDAVDGWRAFRASCDVLATWDDHDYGKNDAGVEWELKRESQTVFLDYFGVPADSPRRAREGVYHAQVFGPPGRRVQVVLLDTRYHRDPLTRKAVRVPGKGPYTASERWTDTLLGETQWAWLAEQLRRPAELRVVVSSIQVVADEHGWEGWGNFPHERERLFSLIDETDAAGVVFVSGDRHLIELSRSDSDVAPYPLWDFTTSGLNQRTQDVIEANRQRVGPVLRTANFGLLRIDWERGLVRIEGRGLDDSVLLSQDVALASLRE